MVFHLTGFLRVVLCGEQITGGAVDIYKCFDQICRPLLHRVMSLSGFPPALLRTYQNFHENLVFHNSLASTLGLPHTRRCGIPQGCPLSMTLIALFLRP